MGKHKRPWLSASLFTALPARLGKALKALRPADVGRFLRSDTLLKKPNGKERAKPTVDQIVRVLRMLLEWAKAGGHVEAVAFPQDALPKRRRKQKAEPQEAAIEATKAQS